MELSQYWSLSVEDQNKIREEAVVETEEEHQAFLDALFPSSYGSLKEVMQASGADGDE